MKSITDLWIFKEAGLIVLPSSQSMYLISLNTASGSLKPIPSWPDILLLIVPIRANTQLTKYTPPNSSCYVCQHIKTPEILKTYLSVLRHFDYPKTQRRPTVTTQCQVRRWISAGFPNSSNGVWSTSEKSDVGKVNEHHKLSNSPYLWLPLQNNILFG